MAQRKGISSGTTAQRSIEEAGKMRFNTTTSLLEYYDGSQWKAIDAPPTVSSVSPSNLISGDGTGNYTIVVTGSGFSNTVTAKIITDGGTEISPDTTTRNSGTQVTLVVAKNKANLTNANEPFDIKIENSSGLSSTLADALNIDATPAFQTAAGSLGIVWDTGRSGVSFTVLATDPESGAVTYSLESGTLPGGLSLNTSTGVISGNASAVGSNTTSTFTIRAKDSASNTTDRQFTIAVNAPGVSSYTSSGTFSVPTGLTSVNVLVIAGGGAGGTEHSGGGGAGGLIYRPGFTVSPGGSVSVTVGGGGQGFSQTRNSGQGPGQGFSGDSGQDSVFGTLTAKGGGGGGTWSSGQPPAGSGQTSEQGKPGGSGGGGSDPNAQAPSSGGSATQPNQSGDSGNYGFGFPGGGGNTSSLGGAGGGAGGAGQPGSQNATGGAGKAYSISGSSVTYAGGGGGGGPNPSPLSRPVGGSGGGGEGGWAPGDSGPSGSLAGLAGTANRGSGGGGGYDDQPGYVTTGGNGGKGIVIVQY